MSSSSNEHTKLLTALDQVENLIKITTGNKWEKHLVPKLEAIHHLLTLQIKEDERV